MFLFLILCVQCFTLKVFGDYHYRGYNVALYKKTTQSPGTFCQGYFTQHCFVSSNAVDGNNSSCSRTKSTSQRTTSWTVTFGRQFYITGIRIKDIQIGCSGNCNYNLSVYMPLGSQQSRKYFYNAKKRERYSETQMDIALATNISVKSLTIQVDRHNYSRHFLRLCEVEVYTAYCTAINIPMNGHAAVFGNSGFTFGTSGNKKNSAGMIIEFHCNTGYFLNGTKYIKCLSSGNYNESIPKCDRIECMAPLPSPQRTILGSIRRPFLVGSQVSFTCETGYRLVGKTLLYINCLQSGYWSDDFPTCQAFKCHNPGGIENGVYTIDSSPLCTAQSMEDQHYKCSITTNCDKGFSLQNCGNDNLAGRRTCEASGHWSKVTCNCEKGTCLYPRDIEHGYYQFSDSSYFINGRAEYDTRVYAVCNLGYRLTSPSSRLCRSDGSWSGQAPICINLTCSYPGPFKHGNYSLVDGSYFMADSLNYGTRIYVNCSHGYQNSGNNERFCSSNGKWNGSTPICKAVECNAPKSFLHGIYTYQNGTTYYSTPIKFGSVILVKCDLGYKNLGDSGRICRINKTWSGETPACSKINCTVPEEIENGIYTSGDSSALISSKKQFGETLFVKCNEGYETKWQSTRTCKADETWTGDTPICNIITCSHPGHESVENGYFIKDNRDYISGALNYSKVIAVVCNTGFYMQSGSSQRTCLANGTWSGKAAICAKVKCSIPNTTTDLIHYTASELTFDESVNISCDEGYARKGPKMRTCLDNGTLDGIDTTCEKIQSEVYASSQMALIGGGTSAGIFIVGATFLVAVLVYRRRQSMRKEGIVNTKSRYSDLSSKHQETGECVEVQETAFMRTATENKDHDDGCSGQNNVQQSDGIYTNTKGSHSDQTYYDFQRPNAIPETAIMVNDLPDMVLKGKLAAEKFNQEFKSFPEGLKDEHVEALKLQNRGKNKYKKLYPYDSTRVILETDNEHGSDYINACYIHGFNKVKAYIAAQGPLRDTIEDFWRMIWQMKISKIAMLTNIKEQGKTKCEQYWPGEGSVTYGDITINLKKTEIFSEFIIRDFTIQKGDVEEKVTQFHFTAWPDKSVPKYASSLVKFRSKVKTAPLYGQGPVVVHCSAGIGRTGTFIAIDYLTDQANALDYIDVAGTVETLRKQRVNMVQTLEQYMFVHHALVETLMLPSSFLPASKFNDAYTHLLQTDEHSQKRKIDFEFEMLKKLSPVAEESQYVSARVVRNRQKNRYSDILPVEEFMPTLTSDDGQHTDYVNAVFLPSYKEKQAFIITQTPLESTKTDFWRLVMEHDIHTIIMMDSLEEIQEKEIYWPDKGITDNHDSIQIVNDSKEDLNLHQVISLTMRKNRTVRYIKQFQFGGWNNGQTLPESPEHVLSLMELVQSWQQQTGSQSILVHCMNGADKSGLYCVIAAVIERMKIEQDVAISHVIEEMRNAREHIIPSVEQYQFCHDAVLAFIQQYATYSNFNF